MVLRKAIVAVVVGVMGWCGVRPAGAGLVVPVLRGVYDPGNGGAMEALWGYENPNGTMVTVPVGAQNFFSPAPTFRGQPTVFMPGTVYGAFVTELGDSPLTWTLAGVSVTADPAGGVSLPVDPTVLEVAGEIVPFVEGVWEYGPGDYGAVFGYASGLGSAVTVLPGASNFMTPAPVYQGQPTTFVPGVVGDAFEVRFTGPSVTWNLSFGGHALTATADQNSPRLGSDPMPEPGSAAGVGVAVVVGGLLRRRRRNPGAGHAV